jgi:hypothetical protein
MMNVARKEEFRNLSTILVGKCEPKRLLGDAVIDWRVILKLIYE